MSSKPVASILEISFIVERNNNIKTLSVGNELVIVTIVSTVCRPKQMNESLA